MTFITGVVRLETKYRDIADGNLGIVSPCPTRLAKLETKYRDIADGNISSRLAAFFVLMLETKYRDIADGNFLSRLDEVLHLLVGNQVPRYSGWKQ